MGNLMKGRGSSLDWREREVFQKLNNKIKKKEKRFFTTTTTTTKKNNNLIMASKYLQKYQVPEGFYDILHEFSREILRA